MQMNVWEKVVEITVALMAYVQIIHDHLVVPVMYDTRVTESPVQTTTNV